ncbi:MAG: type II methionyl aminopeptidase [Methanomassiliicoccales archaeon]
MNERMIKALRRAGSIAAEARDLGREMIGEGVGYLEVADEVEDRIRDRGGQPAFPVNISVNEVAAHYSPSSNDGKRFSSGDVVKLDVGAHVDGFIGDTAVTVEVGTRNHDRLIESADRALIMALEMIGEGVQVGTLGGAIERSIKGDGFEPVVNLTGHSMERYCLHAGITVPNIDDGNLARVKDGMVVAVEPFATEGAGQVTNSKPGNIYRVLRERPLKDKRAQEFFSQLRERFDGLPFCERWCTDLEKKPNPLLRNLVRHGLISSYPILKEIKGGVVSQSEHTVVIRGKKAEILTIT